MTKSYCCDSDIAPTNIVSGDTFTTLNIRGETERGGEREIERGRDRERERER